LVKKFIIVKNATAYTWDWYCHLVVDRASLFTFFKARCSIKKPIEVRKLFFRLFCYLVVAFNCFVMTTPVKLKKAMETMVMQMDTMSKALFPI
jgi:hypothetical protein